MHAPPTRTLVRLAIATGTALAAAGLSTLAASTYLVRRVITPEEERASDAYITGVDLRAEPPEITLRADPAAALPGRYGLAFAGEQGHLRVGEVRRRQAGTVTREILGIDQGSDLLAGGGLARWSGYYYFGDPQAALGVPTEHVELAGELGPMPAWLVPGQSSERWAILIHGRGALREECLRAVAPLRAAGMTVLIPSYRNDPEAAPSLDGRYGLGLREWADVEVAMQYAIDQGAQELVLVGWSMGGAIVLQTLANSPLAERVSRVVLDAPVIDWADVIRHHAELARLPAPISALARLVLGSALLHRLAGLREPLDLPMTDWVARAGELRHPVLLFHSSDDHFVPSGPSQRFAAARPDLVRMVAWTTADHCREWNTDPHRWEQSVREFCAAPAD